MAKRNTQTSEPQSSESFVAEGYQEPAIPAGYEEATEDVVGYWDPEVHPTIHVIPIEASVFDGNIKKNQVSTLIFCKLVDAATVVAKEDREKVLVQAQPGEMIGIWGKPGLRKKIFNLAGVDCYIKVSGTKEVGKPLPMILFSVKYKTKGKALPLVEDRRKESRNEPTWWSAGVGKSKSVDSAAGGDVDDDDIPF